MEENLEECMEERLEEGMERQTVENFEKILEKLPDRYDAAAVLKALRSPYTVEDVRAALEETHGCMTEVVRMLGLPYRILNRMISTEPILESEFKLHKHRAIENITLEIRRLCHAAGTEPNLRLQACRTLLDDRYNCFVTDVPVDMAPVLQRRNLLHPRRRAEKRGKNMGKHNSIEDYKTAIELSQGNKAEAVKLLGVKKRAFYKRLKSNPELVDVQQEVTAGAGAVASGFLQDYVLNEKNPAHLRLKAARILLRQTWEFASSYGDRLLYMARKYT